MKITAVIPTRHRPDDLERAVLSVCAQLRQPDELLVIDQSPDDRSHQRVIQALSMHGRGLAVNYVRDPDIAGLVAAKKAAVARARGDLICFLEDDIVLEPGYLHHVEQGFLRDSRMMGCCGVVTNLPPLPPFYAGMFHFFHRGIYRDARVGVHGGVSGSELPMIPSDYLSGGLSAYRREVFNAVPFDLGNDLFMLEDIDFSTRAARKFGDCFFINPNARLEHRMSPVNRAALGIRQRRKLREFMVFYKKRRDTATCFSTLLLLVGLLLEASYQAAAARTLAPVGGYFRGLWDGVRWKLKPEPQ